MSTKVNVCILLAVLFWGCDMSVCRNTNPLFDKYSPDSKEYKIELVKQMETVNKSKLTYWFKEYVESDGQEFLSFHIKGDGLCAVIVLNVEQWGKLEILRQKKGVSYRGAEFKNLKFDIQQDTADVKFVFRDFDSIID